MGPNSACELFINNTVGNKGPALAIHYWFAGGGEEFQFAGALNQPGLIQMLHVKSVSDLLSDGKLSDKRHNGEKSIDYIIGQLLQKKMYSAAKDLMSMCILWKYGGLYMDTTTLLDEHDLSKALLTTPDHAMFMQVPGGDRTATFMRGRKARRQSTPPGT
jgi:Glycosyltransferase sugar-binding region containing DXD motif